MNQAELTKTLGEEKIEGNREIFFSSLRIAQISNCIPNLDYLEKDIVTGEQCYYFDFKFPDRSRSCQAPLPSSAIAEPRGFVRALLDFTPGGNFEGGARELAILKQKWLNDESRPVPTVRSLPFLGYDEESGTYCYPQFGFNNGGELSVNAHGYIQVKGAGVKTSLVNTRFDGAPTSTVVGFRTSWPFMALTGSPRWPGGPPPYSSNRSASIRHGLPPAP